MKRFLDLYGMTNTGSAYFAIVDVTGNKTIKRLFKMNLDRSLKLIESDMRIIGPLRELDLKEREYTRQNITRAFGGLLDPGIELYKPHIKNGL